MREDKDFLNGFWAVGARASKSQILYLLRQHEPAFYRKYSNNIFSTYNNVYKYYPRRLFIHIVVVDIVATIRIFACKTQNDLFQWQSIQKSAQIPEQEKENLILGYT